MFAPKFEEILDLKIESEIIKAKEKKKEKKE